VGTNYENAANDFLELASEQRLNIIFKLLEKKSKISAMAKELHATVQEVHRNFERLADAGLIVKDKDGYYDLTTYGKTMCTQVPSLLFLSKNRKYFENHDFGDIPMKFIQRIGALAAGQQVKGFVKVLEQWKSIYKNADEFIYQLFTEVPLDLIEPLLSRVKKGVKLNYIFSESVIVPKGRKELLNKLGMKELIDKGLVELRWEKGLPRLDAKGPRRAWTDQLRRTDDRSSARFHSPSVARPRGGRSGRDVHRARGQRRARA